MHDFINRPIWYPDESEIGFLCRLAEVNYRSLSELPIRFPKLYEDESALERFLIQLSAISGVTPIKENVLYLQSYYGNTFPHWRKSLTSRYCPLCLAESLYHRSN
jgi:hypothetical protein